MSYNQHQHPVFPEMDVIVSQCKQIEKNNQNALKIIDKVDVTHHCDKDEYVNSLSAKELHAFAIANQFLKDTFNLEKSNGFIKWKTLKRSPPPIIEK